MWKVHTDRMTATAGPSLGVELRRARGKGFPSPIPGGYVDYEVGRGKHRPTGCDDRDISYEGILELDVSVHAIAPSLLVMSASRSRPPRSTA
ncbi:MAG: hypothetical protein ACP5PJ_00575 [Acidimicrobiales bacterium]